MKPNQKLDVISCASESPARTGTVRVGGLMGFHDLVVELGGDPGHLIAACGLDPGVLGNADNIIPFSVGARLLHLAEVATRCPHFGLLLGQRQNLALLGPIGFLMQHSPDVRSALASLIRYMHLHVEGASAKLTTNGQFSPTRFIRRNDAAPYPSSSASADKRYSLAEFSYHIHIPGIVGAEQVYNICMANEVRFLQLLCGMDWLPSAIHFCYRAPADETPFRKFFRVPVLFNQPSSAVFFPGHYLDRPISSADRNLRDILQKYIQQIESHHSGDPVGQVRSVIRTLLPTGNCTANRVADLFSMHRRTLHRLLAASGTTFEQVMDAMRHEIAVQMLAHSDMKLSQLADMLGYSEVASFNRAFRRWNGMSPSDWRCRHAPMKEES